MQYFHIKMLLVLTTCLGILGCSPSYKQPPSALMPIKEKVAFNKQWYQHAYGSQRAHEGDMKPLVTDGIVYVADHSGYMNRFNYNSGRRIDKQKLSSSITTAASKAGDTVVYATGDATIIASHIQSGKRLWETNVKNEVLTKPVIHEGKVFVKTIDSRLIALDLKSGKELWSYEHDSPELVLRSSSRPVIYQDMVIAGFADGQLVSLSQRSGQVYWKRTISMSDGFSPIEQMVDINSEPLIDGHTLYVASFNGKLSALNLKTGEAIWSTSLSTYRNMAKDNQSIYVVDSQSRVLKLSKKTGQVLWKQEAFLHRGLANPVRHKQGLLLTDKLGYVHVLSAFDGRQLGRKLVDQAGIDNTPLPNGDDVLLYTNSGLLAKFTLKV